MTLGLYIHIPWCPTRCIYCDFNTYIDGETTLKARYHTALLREIKESAATLNHPALDTVFFGGGTPTTLLPEQLLELVETVRHNFALKPNAEITTEANPGSLSVDYLHSLRQGGINRLSLGVQSFDDGELAFLSRIHDAAAAREAVAAGRAAGFENISLDLIFNLPQQTLARWQYNLREALKLEPDHFSVYALIVEPGTPLHRQVTQGDIPAPDDDIAADMYTCTMDTLAEAGYSHYEISNWAKSRGEADTQTPGLASAHNLIYWRNQAYLGLGAGAFGTIQGQRWANVKRPQDYVYRIMSGNGLGVARDEKSFETIEWETAITEHMMLGLRLLREGISAATFEKRFGVPLAERFPQAIETVLQRNLAEWAESTNGPCLRLTRQGAFVANQAVLAFL